MLIEEILNEAAARLPRSPSPVWAYDDDGDDCGLVYFAPETQRWLAVDVNACQALVDEGPEYDRDVYSRWCSSPAAQPSGDGATAQEAIDAAGW